MAPAHSRRDRVRQLLSQQPATPQRLADRGNDLVDVLDLVRDVVGVTDDRSPRRGPQGELVGGMDVERAAQRPRLHELTPLPERVAHVGLRDPVDASRELELGGAHHLRVDAADVTDDLDEPVRGRSLVEVASREPSRANLVPGEPTRRA